MDEVESTILVVPLLAVLAPILARSISRWLPVPIVVFELVLGIVAGPEVLGWARPMDFAAGLSELGLATLFFVAGTEIEAAAFRGRLGKRAAIGWLISLAAAVLLSFALVPGEEAFVIGIALSSTTMGTILPILRDARELRTPFGKAVSAVGVFGEFGPLIAISIFLGSRDPSAATVVLAAFAVIAGLGIWLAFRLPHGRMHTIVSATLHTSGQFAIRVVLLILAALVALSIALELDMLLGAFTAGIIWRLVMADASERDREFVETKIEGLAFGFLIPVFFIYTGVTFDLRALLEEPLLFAALPIGLVALFIVRGLPSALAAPEGSSTRDRLSLVLLGATGLPIIVAVTAIGVDKGIMTTTQQSVLVATGMLSVLVFPLVGMAIRGERITHSSELFQERTEP